MDKQKKKCGMKECQFYEKDSILCSECARNYCSECPARNSCDATLECIYEDHFQYYSGDAPVKKTFRVNISQQYVHSATVEVEAYTVEEAEKKALNEIGDTSLSIDEGVEGTEQAHVIGEA